MEEKILYRFCNPNGYDDSDKYAYLSPMNLKFLNWLSENGYIDDDIITEPIDKIPAIAEF